MRLAGFRAITATLLFPLATLFAAEQPSAEQVLDKFVEVTGGRAAYESIKTEITTGTLEISAMGLTGNLTSYKAAPDKSYTVVEFAGVGKAEEGSNGEVAWSINGMEGPRIKQGEERALAMRNNAMHSEVRWRDYFKKVELAGAEDVDGKPCYKIVMTPGEGKPETRYYAKSSNLLVRVTLSADTPNGPADVELDLSDYRDEGGLMTPHTISQKLPNAEILVKLAGIKRNEEIPSERFDLPAEIKGALAQKK
ncbi:MAG: hypothetical protein U0Q18_26975 [Bryobacteraceae bacterium]